MEHDLTKTCWCEPEHLQACPECDAGEFEGVAQIIAEKDTSRSECWKCGGRGLVEVFVGDGSVIVVHRKDNPIRLINEALKCVEIVRRRDYFATHYYKKTTKEAISYLELACELLNAAAKR